MSGISEAYGTYVILSTIILVYSFRLLKKLSNATASLEKISKLVSEEDDE